MSKDLTASVVDRQNILNNSYAVQKIQENVGLNGIFWRDDCWFTKQQVAELFDVDLRTIERYIENNGQELKMNGYLVIRGADLQEIKEVELTDINVGRKATSLGIFSFRAVLNLAMLLTESENAKHLRSRILDIVIDVLAEKTGGHTKYINQRDTNYLIEAYKEESERQKFTAALNDWIDMGNYKYAYYTNKIYQSIFRENAKEYREILNLQAKDKVRETLYSEVLRLIASYEAGFAYELNQAGEKLGRKLKQAEADRLFEKFENHPLYGPLISDARSKMASRDLCFREALHKKLDQYIKSVPREDFNRFLGEASKSLQEQIDETKDVFNRLKER